MCTNGNPLGDYLPAIFMLFFITVGTQYEFFDGYNESNIVVQVNFKSYSNTIELHLDKDEEILDCDRKVQLGYPGQFPLVFLTSFPGSGNTWTRLLIEDVSGYYSGSVYWDKSLYDGGFIGEKEGIRNGTTVVMKNHNVKCLSDAKGILFLVRNPYDAILAEFNRKQGKSSKSDSKHTASANHDVFNTTKWFDVADKLAVRWVDLHSKYAEYARTNNIPMHVFFYEDLKVNSTKEMTRLLNFYQEHFEFYPDDADRRLRCLSKLEEINASFKRKKVPFEWEIYPKKIIHQIDQYVTQVRSLFAVNNYPELPNYYRYTTNDDNPLISENDLKEIRAKYG